MNRMHVAATTIAKMRKLFGLDKIGGNEVDYSGGEYQLIPDYEEQGRMVDSGPIHMQPTEAGRRYESADER